MHAIFQRINSLYVIIKKSLYVIIKKIVLISSLCVIVFARSTSLATDGGNSHKNDSAYNKSYSNVATISNVDNNNFDDQDTIYVERQTTTEIESVLSLEKYLASVRAGNSLLKSSKTSEQVFSEKSKEAQLIITPTLSAETAWRQDRSPRLSVASQGDSSWGHSTSLTYSQNTTCGMLAKLSYATGYTDIEGANPAFLPQTKYYDGKMSLSLIQSLLRNNTGQEIKAIIALSEAQSRSQKAGEQAKQKILIIEAEVSYWRLTFARQWVKIQKDSLVRSEKLRDWNGKKVSLRLADRRELIQAEAIVKVRQMELQSALDEERIAALNFNFYRGKEGHIVSEQLLNIDSALQSTTVQRKKRADTEVVREQVLLAKANAQASQEKNRKSLDLFASADLNGRDSDWSEAISQSFTSDKPVYTVGLRFMMTLDSELLNISTQNANKDALAQQLRFEHKQREEEKEWQDLQSKLEENKKRFTSSLEIEKIQKDKYEYEKNLYSIGRSTTFQVLQFEQDYASSQLNRLRIQWEALVISAQIKIFGGES